MLSGFKIYILSKLDYPKVTNLSPKAPTFLVNLLFKISILGNSDSIVALKFSNSATGFSFNHKTFKSGNFYKSYFTFSKSSIKFP